MKAMEKCLLLSPDDKHALHLYAILLTAQKQTSQAYREIFRAANQYPDIKWSLFLSLSLSSLQLIFDPLVCCWPKPRSKKSCMATNSRSSRVKRRCFSGSRNSNRSFRRISIKSNRLLNWSNRRLFARRRERTSLSLVEHIARRILPFIWRPMRSRALLREHRKRTMERRILFF